MRQSDGRMMASDVSTACKVLAEQSAGGGKGRNGRYTQWQKLRRWISCPTRSGPSPFSKLQQSGDNYCFCLECRLLKAMYDVFSRRIQLLYHRDISGPIQLSLNRRKSKHGPRSSVAPPSPDRLSGTARYMVLAGAPLHSQVPPTSLSSLYYYYFHFNHG